MARKKKSIFSFFEPDVEGCDIDGASVDKKPLDDCEGIPTDKNGNVTYAGRAKTNKDGRLVDSSDTIEALRIQNTSLRQEIESLESILAEVQNERESLKKEVSSLRLQVMKSHLRENAESDACERYRTSGLPARRVKRIPSKSILFKGQSRKPL